MIIFESKDLRLRFPTPQDAERISFYGDNRKIWLNCTDNFPHPYPVSLAEKWIAERLALSPLQDAVIEFQGEAIGWIGITFGKNIWTNQGEIGYWIGEPFWGKGIVSQALPPFVDYCFTHHAQLHKIHLYAYTRNKASIRIFKKAGFIFEATFIQNCVKDGVIEDEVGYYLLRSQWEQHP